MALKEELGLKTDFASPAHEALLNIYYTASIMKKRADGFFGQFGLTDVQFNLLNLLYYESGKEGGQKQDDGCQKQSRRDAFGRPGFD